MTIWKSSENYLVEACPFSLHDYPSHEIEQGYLNTEPVVRIRRYDDSYVLTYKSKGFLVREEYNLPLTKEAYEHLRTKIDGRLIQKTALSDPFRGRTDGGTGLFPWRSRSADAGRN